jgi:peptidoglycan/xylan/chitin deacetylase (PgdA/CDA1 family)
VRVSAKSPPSFASEPPDMGITVSAHGWRWEGHADLEESEERDRIARTVAAIKAVTGTRPVGWHTRSPGSVTTRRLLVEEGGFLYATCSVHNPVGNTLPSNPKTKPGGDFTPLRRRCRIEMPIIETVCQSLFQGE